MIGKRQVRISSDITNKDFQELLLSWAKKQIDCGADAIWIDMLYAQAKKIAQVTKDIKHPAFKESFAASARIVDEPPQIWEIKRQIYLCRLMGIPACPWF